MLTYSDSAFAKNRATGPGSQEQIFERPAFISRILFQMKFIIALFCLLAISLASPVYKKNIDFVSSKFSACRKVIEHCENRCKSFFNTSTLTNLCVQYEKDDKTVVTESDCRCSVKFPNYSPTNERHNDLDLGCIATWERIFDGGLYRKMRERNFIIQSIDYLVPESSNNTNLTFLRGFSEYNFQDENHISVADAEGQANCYALYIPKPKNLSSVGLVSASLHHRHHSYIFEIDFAEVVGKHRTECESHCDLIGTNVKSFDVKPLTKMFVPFYSVPETAGIFRKSPTFYLPEVDSSCECSDSVKITVFQE